MTLPVAETMRRPALFGAGPWTRPLLVGILMAGALALRLYRIDAPPYEFHAVRQFHSAIIARGFYVTRLSSASPVQRTVAETNLSNRARLEPRLLERVAAFGYRVLGREALWLPRSLSAVFWVLGGFFLYRLARRVISPDAAVLATLWYLFFPFGVLASRSFQPDPLMLLLEIAALDALLRYAEDPRTRSLFWPAALSGLAMFVKATGALLLVAAFAGLAIRDRAVRRDLLRARSVLILALCLAPMAWFYGHGFFAADFLQSSGGANFKPAVFAHPFFWGRWIEMITSVFGVAGILGALAGTVFLSKGIPRTLVVSLWVGSVVYGLVFNYPIHTHDYYQLPLVPLVALSLAAVGEALVRALLSEGGRGRTVLAWALLAGFVGASGVWAYKGIEKGLREGAVETRVAREIGEAVGHSSRTICLLSAGGTALWHEGDFAGILWPPPPFARVPAPRDEAMTPASRLEQVIRDLQAEFFVVRDFETFRREKDIRTLLEARYPVAARTEDYRVFDLRGSSPASAPPERLPEPGRP